ncbi:YidH family protein [Pseudodesulfovibrio cashew]|nr:DUF202 domain-containing protein [Pseudodesulfovibrio cashew]
MVPKEETRLELAEERNEESRVRSRLARQRTRLANQRTFLAWCRTALSFMAFGFVLEKVDVFLASQGQTVSAVLLRELGTLGKFTFMAGPVFVIFAGVRYYHLDKDLGFRDFGRSALPEVILMVAVVGAALLYVFS